MGNMRLVPLALLAAAFLLPTTPVRTAESDAREAQAAMGTVLLTLRNADGGLLRLTARVADQPRERRQGFRGLDAEQARGVVLLHRLERPDLRPWTMRQVAIPLEVFWLDGSGQVFQAASLYVGHDLYQPERPVSAALQAPRGELSSQGVGPGSRIVELRFLEQP